MTFREDIFLKSLIERPDTARFMAQVFAVEWLEDVRLRPILRGIYDFLEKEKTPPSLSTLHQILSDQDASLYENRYREVLGELEKVEFTTSDLLYNLERARTVALARSFKDRFESQLVRELMEEDRGDELLQEFEEWTKSFHDRSDGVEATFKEAVDDLLRSAEFVTMNKPIPTGVAVLDQLSGGGLKTRNLGIIIAPTGGGKSVALLNIAYNIATLEQRNVLFLTNELTMEETTERFLSRLLQIPNDQLINDHALIADKVHDRRLEKHWGEGLDGRLRIVEKIEEFSTDYIEGLAHKYFMLYGWRPDVIVVDYMERMCPTAKDVRRRESWIWLGQVARDLVRVAKKNNWLVWTAAQTNRSGLNAKNELGMEQAQGSIHHLQEAALVVMMRRVPVKGWGDTTLEFKAVKARHYLGGEKVYYSADFARMTIKNEQRQVTAMDILQGEDDVAQAAAGAWGGGKG